MLSAVTATSGETKEWKQRMTVHEGPLVSSVPRTCTVIMAELFVVTPACVLDPVHTYTPSSAGYWAFTMCNVDIKFPGVTSMLPPPPIVMSVSVDMLVWEKFVSWLLSVQVMVGTGTPVEVQEMSTFPLSLTLTSPLLTLVMASSAKVHSILSLLHDVCHVRMEMVVPGAITVKVILFDIT